MEPKDWLDLALQLLLWGVPLIGSFIWFVIRQTNESKGSMAVQSKRVDALEERMKAVEVSTAAVAIAINQIQVTLARLEERINLLLDRERDK